MFSDEDARSICRRIAFLATAEILIFPLVMIPGLSTGIFVLPFIDPWFILVAIGYLPLILLSGFVVDIALAQIRRRPKDVPDRSSGAIKHLLDELSRRGAPSFAVSRIKILPTDLTVGAYVRGAFRPAVVLSAGLLVNLLRNRPSAKAVLCHELGHVINNDKFYLSLLFAWVASIAVLFLPSPGDYYGHTGSPWTLPSILITLWIVSRVSRRREHMADAVASTLCGSGVLASCLASVEAKDRSRGGFFHPSLEERIQSVSSGSTARLRPSIWVIGYCLVSILPNISQVVDTGDPLYASFCIGATLVIILELSRLIVLPSSLRDRVQ